MAKKQKVPTGTIRPQPMPAQPLDLSKPEWVEALAKAFDAANDGAAQLDWIIVKAERERDRHLVDSERPIDPDSVARDLHQVLVNALAAREALTEGRAGEAVAHALRLGLSVAWVRTRAFEPLVASAQKLRTSGAKGGTRRKVDPVRFAAETARYEEEIRTQAKPPHGNGSLTVTNVRKRIARREKVPYSRVLRLTTRNR